MSNLIVMATLELSVLLKLNRFIIKLTNVILGIIKLRLHNKLCDHLNFKRLITVIWGL